MKIRQLLATLALSAVAISASAQAKYVFYFIGDGMGMGHINTAETYNRDVLHSDQPILMNTFPVASQARTYSYNFPITDSAAAGTALSTGHKTNNNMVGMGPDSTMVYSIANDFLKEGRAVGILSSVAGDDATPAAFYGHAISRKMKGEISGYAPQSGVTFFGAPMFRGMTDKDGNPSQWVENMKQAGYGVVNTLDELLATRTVPNRVLMLAAEPQGEQLGYTLDAIPGALTLQEMTEAALYVLEADPDGFFMMCEGGNIDWAAHANDGATVVKEVLNFQKAIDVAYRFYLEHPDETLIVVTADHDTGGMALGRKDNNKNIRLDLMDFQKISKDRFADMCKANYKDKSPNWDEMRTFLAENLGLWGGIQLTEAEEQEIRKSFDETFVTRRAADEKTLYNDFNNFTMTVWDVLNRHYGVGFTTVSHTGNLVPVFAIGAGSDLFKGQLNNTDIPKLILQASH